MSSARGAQPLVAGALFQSFTHGRRRFPRAQLFGPGGDFIHARCSSLSGYRTGHGGRRQLIDAAGCQRITRRREFRAALSGGF